MSTMASKPAAGAEGTSAAAPRAATTATAAVGKKAAGKRSNAQKMQLRATVHRWLRLCIQIVFLILAPGVWNSAFNGVKYLFAQIGGLAAIELGSFVVMLIAMLLFTIVFGRFFCGYACAFGTLGDVVYGIVDFVLKKLKLPHPRIPERAMSVLAWGKYVVLVAICGMCLAGVWGSISSYSPWVAFAAFTSGSLGNVHVLAYLTLGVVVVGMAFSERFFCRVLCPMGAVFSLMPVLGVSSFTRVREHCAKNCGRCHAACPVGIWPDADTLAHGECISCGRCADVCPMNNVNFIAIEKQLRADKAAGKVPGGKAPSAADVLGADMLPQKEPRPVRKTRATWHLLKGSGVGVVLLKAVLLLVLLWALGSVRYVPALPLAL